MLAGQFQDFRLSITAHQAQTMSFLELPTMELKAELTKELQENPALELVDEWHCPQCGRRLRRFPCPVCLRQTGEEAAIVYVSPRDSSSFWRERLAEDEADQPEPGMPERLDEYVLRQIGPVLADYDQPIAQHILALLSDDGRLPESTQEIAVFLRTPIERVERVLALIQRADPPGIAARSAEECLLLQLEALSEIIRSAHLPLARAIIAQHFDLLGRREYARLARLLGVTRAAVETAAEFIQRNLTPYPAWTGWGESRTHTADSNMLGNPDVTIARLPGQGKDRLIVEVYTPLSGWLRVNPDFKAALTECSNEEREKWGPAVERATLIAKCVQHRNNTMRRLMEILVVRQRAFILGDDGDLQPLTRVEIARRLELHESTISRAVADKCVALPDGRIVPLARFFDRSLSVRDRVRTLIESEARPLTDDEISVRLAAEGIDVARRTVAKYRNMLGILPAGVRARLARSRSTFTPASVQ